MKHSLLSLALSAFVLLAPGVQAQTAGSAPAITISASKPVDAKAMRLFNQIFERIRSEYVEGLSDQQLIDAAIAGMVGSLDPHSRYLNADNFASMREKTAGEFGGVGVELSPDPAGARVTAPIEGSPAARAGIRAGDIVIEVDGKPVQGLNVTEVSDRLRGAIGSDVSLKLRRGDAPIAVALKREQIKSRPVRFETDGNIGYIRITSFNAQTQAGLEAATREIASRLGPNLTGYVLDLRNNPGGLVRQAVSVADSFLDAGLIVETRGRNGREIDRHIATPGDLARGLPIVVLMNGGSASASEIVAGALQDNKRAIVLGTQSYGKGSVQTIMPLDRGTGALKITTARYYTPSGRSIQAVGIKPDVEVRQSEQAAIQEPKIQKESELPHALRNDTLPVASQASAPASATAKPAAAPAPKGDIGIDDQRRQAIEMIQRMNGSRSAGKGVPASQQSAALPG